ncbi:ArsR/SmtB family transcription factor [Amycolatopsis magusensis]|uniref:ArsR/SmtB family transcription factor n=1 Tax=Amycolatopsis magusensis TaxID=882444 RepID=UPI0037AD98E3
MGAERRNATEAEANALASGIRLRIIRLTFKEALTNKELAGRLGKDPATVLHHVRKLVDTGFLAPQPARRGNRGAKEIPYLSTRLSWNLRLDESEELGRASLEAYLAEVGEVGTAKVEQTRLVVQLPEPEQGEFKRRLYELIEEYADRPIDPGAERTAIYLALYPSA